MALRKFASIIAAAGVATLAITCVASPASAGTIDGTDGATINTYAGWDGVSYLYPFGAPNTTTYGQVITVPDGKTMIDYFTFYLADDIGTGTLTMRGEVYGWNGTMATTKIFQSKKKTLSLDRGRPRLLPRQDQDQAQGGHGRRADRGVPDRLQGLRRQPAERPGTLGRQLLGRPSGRLQRLHERRRRRVAVDHHTVVCRFDIMTSR